MNKSLLSTTALIGTIMGAGFLGLPFIAKKSGVTITLTWLIILAIVMCFVMLTLGEIILRTKKQHHLAGYTQKYLGNKAKKIMVLSMIIGIYSALLAYIIAESQTISYVFSTSLNNTILAGIVFWVIASLTTYGGTKILKKSELVGVTLVILLIIGIIFLAGPKIKIENLTEINLKNGIAPIGLIVFSLLGYSALPEVRKINGEKAKTLKNSIIYAYVLIVLIYALFIISITGVLGDKTPEIATLALGRFFASIGIITMFTAYIALANALIDMFRYDYAWTKKQSWMIVTSIPLALFALIAFTKIASFTTILELAGLISGGLTLTLICMMAEKAKKNGDRIPEYTIPYKKSIARIIILFFIFATLFEAYSIFA